MIERLLLSRVDERLPLPAYCQLIGRLYGTPRAVVLGSACCTAIFGALTAVREQDSGLGVLTIAATASILYLFSLVRRQFKWTELSYREAVDAEIRFWVATCGSCMMTGGIAACAVLLSDSVLTHLLVVVLVMATMALALRNYFRPRLVMAQLALVSTPGAVALLTKNTLEYWTIGLGAFALCFILGRTATSLSSEAREIIAKDRELSDQNTRFGAALNNMSHGLCMFDAEGRLLVCNESYLRIYGFSPEVVKPGVSLHEVLAHSIEIGNHSTSQVDELHDKFIHDLIARNEIAVLWNELDDGRTIALSHQPLETGGWVTTHEDITARREAEAQITHMARHDTLTGLPNRVSFRDALEEALDRIASHGHVAVLYLDLDRFKTVNDTLGHPVGDALLGQVAERLKASVREKDLLARLGGDEFAIIQTASHQPASATGLAERIISALRRPFYVGSHQISIGGSIGISVAPEDSREGDQLLKNADMALYQAKGEGCGEYRCFAPKMDEEMQVRRVLEMDLRRAIVDGELELYYQPLVQISDGSISGFEALLRWNHPTRGMILPSEFVPLAEDIGLITPIGEWVLREACATAANWPGNTRVAVNLSPVQFKSRDLVRVVTLALAVSGLQPARLELEITEGVLLMDTKETLEILHQLRGLGARFSLDDFGTGYSSLSYLRSFPFDKIKIDQSFVQDIHLNSQSLAIVRAISGLASSLGIKTTAEGIESREQLDQLRSEGCTEAQGYFFGRPMNAASAIKLLRDNSARYSSQAA